ncbi:hypothetical protein [Hydrogenimonas urashimensis]|uniref:hypothetical protein n=1 Tax=Hydrogenimonas urashimensis TaxID=2740515 RepID=UPI001915E37E|nr:hypothetical protein [Hydrogenimonas urashimensis]
MKFDEALLKARMVAGNPNATKKEIVNAYKALAHAKIDGAIIGDIANMGSISLPKTAHSKKAKENIALQKFLVGLGPIGMMEHLRKERANA